MPKYQITSPDGKTFEVTAPDGASQDQVLSFAQAQFKQRVDSRAKQEAADRETYSPTKGMSGFEKFVAGYGGAVPGMVRGVGQMLGLTSQEDVDEAKKLDAPLMATGAGMAGNIAGNVAATLPAVAIPGAATLPGAAVVGGALGAAQPVATGESRLANATVGAAAGAGGVALGRTLAAGLAGSKALAEPFTEAGRNRIAGRVINRFAEDPASIANTSSAPTITGARPTLAEQTGDRGLARLQDSLASVDPQINNQLAGRASENNAARVATLRDLAGEGGARDFAAANRAATGEQLYGDAFQASNAVTPSQLKAQASLLNGPRIQALLETPAIADAREAAKTIAANKGVKIDDPSGSIEGLHYMKLAMDDAIEAAKSKGTASGANLADSIKRAQGRLVGAIETLSPDYKAARVTYADMSKPVNAFDTAAELVKRGLSNGSDLSGNQTINRNALLGAVKDEPSLIRKATGRDAAKSLDDLFAPDDLAKLRAVVGETDRAGAVAAAGNGPGSATAQRMASQNILNQLVGPTGLPQSWAESALANTVIGKPLNLLYGGVAEPRIQKALAEAVLNPDRARQVLAAAKIPPADQETLLRLVAQQAARSAPGALAVSGKR